MSFRLVIALVVLVATAALSAIGPDDPIGASHRFFYSASWNALPVARAELTIERDAVDGGRARLAGHAETLPLLDLLWRMRDSFDATVATTPPGPQRYVLRQHENAKRLTSTIVRDEDGQHLLGTMEKRGKVARSAITSLTPRVHDPASLAYRLCSAPPALADTETLDVFIGTKTYRLTARAIADESVTTAGRSWPARRLHLTLGLVPVEEGGTTTSQPKVQNADVWVSTGPDHLPLRLTSWTYWGFVSMQLVGPAS
jgi:uncharacterized protein DUF3108